MELSQVAWSQEEKDAFCASQFAAQTRHYREHYVGAEFWVIEREGVPVGRLYLHRQPHDFRVMDIALIPAARGGGLGSALLRAILDEAARAGAAVSIHVEQFNPALALYERLGFRPVEQQGVYFLMKWTGS
jgi:GNAT superfamily N-acetyltransferase